jgi:hypothetical protein
LLKDNLSEIIAVTANNEMIPYLTNKVPREQFRYPKFDPYTKYYFNYSIAKSELTINKNDSSFNKADFAESLNRVKSFCSCDINQIKKAWLNRNEEVEKEDQPSGDNSLLEQQPEFIDI